MTLPPGIIAFLYKLRWDIEKVFDELKNKFCQQQAWGRSAEAKQQQALFMTLSHNLLVLLEQDLEVNEGILDEKVRKKHADHIARNTVKAKANGRTPNPLVAKFSRVTQRSLQFIRWLQWGLTFQTPWEKAVSQLRPLLLEYPR